MPVITYVAAPMDADRKKALIRKLTDVSMEITGIPEQCFTILIQELAPQAIGIAGKPFSETMPTR